MGGHILDILPEPRNFFSPQRESKGKKRRLNEKVSSAVFRAWTDKQREFYVAAKCNLTLQTSLIHWNIPATQHIFREYGHLHMLEQRLGSMSRGLIHFQALML